MTAFKHIAIIGLGLIGSSLARATKTYCPDITVSLYDNAESVRERASVLKLGDVVADDIQEAVCGADLVLLCVPVRAMGTVAAEMAPALKKDVIICDTGSVKVSVAKTLQDTLPDHVIVPSHPLAGTENNGPDAGFAQLFQGHPVILTPDSHTPAQAIAHIAEYWEDIGGRVNLMSAEHHDHVLALTSHLPHVIAYQLIGMVSGYEEKSRTPIMRYSAGSFRDATRVAASEPRIWQDIMLENAPALLPVLDHFIADLTRIRTAIASQDGDYLLDHFKHSQKARLSLNKDHEIHHP
ncbi:MAG: cyclohexadienyl dehydrogenase [Zymomonas mobilis]|uniref:Cyclohexadieny/prephenate dehydrogenase n=1 Tax=Zymomonas mobilis TaxID=542 RepID=A0A542W019_ZYMMB|nr:cyclohexadienyl dehydrogenase [Zymomonas mobilis]TQL16910.1 cyclohexadieny/prephenate dehydrogenase [Zymomonas mobilis]